MQGTITIIRPCGHITMDVLDEKPTLEQIQAAVEGFIEPVPGLIEREGNRCIAFWNDNAANDGLERNPLATEVWWAAFPEATGQYHVKGNLVILEGDDAFLDSI